MTHRNWPSQHLRTRRGKDLLMLPKVGKPKQPILNKRPRHPFGEGPPALPHRNNVSKRPITLSKVTIQKK